MNNKEKITNQEIKIYNNLNDKVKKEVHYTIENHHVYNGKVYNMDGEDISHLYDYMLKPKIKNVDKEKMQSFHELHNYEKEQGGFVFMFYKYNLAMHQYNLNKAEIARLLYLITYVDYDTNRIMADNGRRFKEEDLCNLLRLKPRQCKEYIKKLVSNEAMIIDYKGDMYINYNICKAGSINVNKMKKNDVQYIRLFKRTVRHLFETSEVREFPKIANIYMVLPYVNLYTNIVSYNPNEKNIDLIEPMSIKDLAQNLSYVKVEAFKKAIAKTVIDNEYVFGFFIEGELNRNNMKVIVNPKIVYAGSSEHLEAIKVLFKPVKKSSI